MQLKVDWQCCQNGKQSIFDFGNNVWLATLVFWLTEMTAGSVSGNLVLTKLAVMSSSHHLESMALMLLWPVIYSTKSFRSNFPWFFPWEFQTNFPFTTSSFIYPVLLKSPGVMFLYHPEEGWLPRVLDSQIDWPSSMSCQFICSFISRDAAKAWIPKKTGIDAMTHEYV